MSLTFTGGTGIFDTLGAVGGLIRATNGFRASTAPSPSSTWGSSGANIHDLNTAFTNIVNTVPSSNKPLIDGIFQILTTFRSNVGGQLPAVKQLAQSWFISLVNADTTLSSLSMNAAMTEFLRQFKNASQTVKSNTVGQTVTAGSSNTGTTKIICNTVGPDGLTRELIYPETLTAKANSDQNSGATAGSEVLTVSGLATVSDKFSYLWPGGSGASGSLAVVNPVLNGSGGNVLYNSGFDSFTTNVPANWSIAVGTAGTTVKQNASVVHASYSTSSLEIVGNGSEQTSLTQQFNNSGGTTVTLAQQTCYPVLGWCKVSSVPVAGVLKIELIDGGNNVLNDDNGTANAITISLPGQTTSWAVFSGWFRTPTNLPSTVKIRIRLSTALDNAISVYVDDMAMAGNAIGRNTTVDLYPGGPLLAAFRGTADVVKNDSYSVAMTNTMSGFYGAQTAGLFQTLFDVLFDTRGSFILPSSGSPTISDSLVS